MAQLRASPWSPSSRQQGRNCPGVKDFGKACRVCYPGSRPRSLRTPPRPARGAPPGRPAAAPQEKDLPSPLRAFLGQPPARARRRRPAPGLAAGLALLLCCLGAGTAAAAPPDLPSATAVVEKCLHYMRGDASESVADMLIHRPTWERTMTIRAWTRGRTESLFVILQPPRDQGNGTLKIGQEMWVYNPKVNRVIKLPPSMMSQSWMGSDFSNNDLAKSDTLVNDYDHYLEGTEKRDGHAVDVVKSIPKPRAPVVWGMLRLKIRDDGILLEEAFYDEDLEPVKTMTCLDIRPLGGKLFPAVWQISPQDKPDQFTRLSYQELKFLDSLPPAFFSLDNLRNPESPR
ncbi:MAG: outer membrane lipoprotein-sorting protein [Deltaproteobacteria bacterium]|nr:outer membrane lipoprotein-sorting protein [Deltaproteobacteria bacterium]